MFHGKTVDFINVRLVFQQEKEEFVFDHVWSFLQVWFFVNEIFVFNFQACVLKEKILKSGLQYVCLDSLYNTGASAWQAEQTFKFNKLWDCVVSLGRQGLWKSPVMLLTAHKLLYLILPLSFSPPFSELYSWEGSLLFFFLSVRLICWSWVRTGLLLGSCQAFFIRSLLG